MEFTTLIDNIVYGEVLTAEHDLSFLVKAHNKTILFDTGQTGAILKNAEYLDEDLETVDYVVLSHGHYDHCGGLESFLSINSKAKVFMKSKAIEDKFRKDYKSIGFKLQKKISDYPNEFIFIDEDTEIAPGVWLMADICQYRDSFSSNESLFIKIDNHYVSDPFQDELFMLIEESGKNHLFTGCSHKGILNIIKTASEALSGAPIETVAGGMHINTGILNEIDGYLNQFDSLNVKNLFVNHCTGIEGYFKLRSNLSLNVHYAFTGFKYSE